MKHPLTSKERRGLMAVAAAALLCIGAGFVFRSCPSGRNAPASVTVIDNDSVRSEKSERSEKSGHSDRSEKSGKSKKAKKSKGSKAEKTYPSRSPLDEPIGN